MSSSGTDPDKYSSEGSTDSTIMPKMLSLLTTNFVCLQYQVSAGGFSVLFTMPTV